MIKTESQIKRHNRYMARRDKELAKIKEYNLLHKEEIRIKTKERVMKNGYHFSPIDKVKRKAYRSSMAYRISDRKAKRKFESTPEGKMKRRCYSAVYEAIKKGTLIIKPCIYCGTTHNIQKHHEDYTKPLEVEFFCEPHHKQFHIWRDNLTGKLPIHHSCNQ